VTEPLVRQTGSEVFQGMVRLHGELWRAVSREEIPAGARVRVTRIEGLTLHVVVSGQHAANA
jgi:membrane protein implicated in regulation of membrane protease activity